MPYKTDRTYYFSDRDKQILSMLAEGLTHTEIGKIIFISARTVDNIILEMQKAFNAKNTPHLVSIAYDEGHLLVKNKL